MATSGMSNSDYRWPAVLEIPRLGRPAAARAHVSRLGKISRADFDAMLEQHMAALDPAAREILKRIAAGDDDPLGGVTIRS
jgi:hypothetical protein